MEKIRMKLMGNSDLYPNLGDERNNNQRSQPASRHRNSKSESDLPGKYGAIPGIEPGTKFADREHCLVTGVHTTRFAGIHGSKPNGAYSVCLSGGYEDTDEGETFIYTGTGGQEDSFRGEHTQTEDQSFGHRSNAWLMMSLENQNPVRVVRGSGVDSKWAPYTGYRYDGLYVVTDAYREKGESGHQMCKFVFKRLANQTAIPERISM